MFTKRHILLAAMALSAGFTTATQAAIVSSSQIQTTDFQNFTFALNAPGYAGGASTVTVRAQSDFNDGAGSGEDFTLYIEGVNYGTFGFNSPSAYDVVDYRVGTNNFNALAFSVDVLLNAATTASALSNGALNVLVDFGSQVNVNCGWSNASNCLTNSGTAPFAKVSFSYNNVPEPGSLALMGLGFAGLMAKRRKNKAKA